MEKSNYKFREGFGWKIDPQVAGKEIEKIASLHNHEVTPQLVIEEAKNPSSPLHEVFEWDNQNAGYKWRLHQARQLIASLVIDITISAPEEVRAYVNISIPEQGNAYCSIHDVMDDDEKMQIIINDAKRKLSTLSSQLRVYQKMRDFANKIDELVLELSF